MGALNWAVCAADKALPLLSRLPFFVQVRVLEPALNKVLAEPLAANDLAFLEGRWLHLRVEAVRLAWFVSLQGGRLIVREHAQADVSIAGGWRDFVLLASREEDPDTLFFRRRLLLEGDTELGLVLKNVLDSLDPERLPPYVWRLLQRTGQQLAAFERQSAGLPS